MFKITSNSKEFMRELYKREGALQKVTAATLTDTAQAVTTRSERNLLRSMIVRTPYTLKSLKTYKASPKRPIEKQDAISGTVSPYLPIQDEGGKIRARRKMIAVPTNVLRGKDRKRKVPAKFRLANMGSITKSNPQKLFKLKSGIYYRKGEALGAAHWGKQRRYDRMFGAVSRQKSQRAMVKVRSFVSSIRLRGRKWHSEAVEKYGNWAYMATVFKRQAQRYLKGVQ